MITLCNFNRQNPNINYAEILKAHNENLVDQFLEIDSIMHAHYNGFNYDGQLCGAGIANWFANIDHKLKDIERYKS